MESSITLPNWQAGRLKMAIEKLKLAGYENPQQALFHRIITLVQRKVRRLECQTRRTKRRNTKEYSYNKISVRWLPATYNQVHARADHAKITVSYIMDLALRLYLETVLQELLGGLPAKVQFKSWPRNRRVAKEISGQSFILIRELCGIYQRDTRLSTPISMDYAVSIRKKPPNPVLN